MSHITKSAIPKGAIGGERVHPLRLRYSQSGLSHLTPYLGFLGRLYSFPDNTAGLPLPYHSPDASCR